MRLKRRVVRLWLQLPRWPYLCLLVALVGLIAVVLAQKYSQRVELAAKFNVV